MLEKLDLLDSGGLSANTLLIAFGLLAATTAAFPVIHNFTLCAQFKMTALFQNSAKLETSALDS